MTDDFWKSLLEGHVASTYSSSVDQHLSGKSLETDFKTVRELSDYGRTASALSLPVTEGTRVFFAGSLGSYLSMENPPAKGMVGEVIAVRTASGNLTSYGGMVFVKWADGQLRSVHADYLRLAEEKSEEAALEDACWEGYEAVGMKDKDGKKVPNCVPKSADFLGVKRFRVATLGDISQFLKVAEGRLIHKSTKDLWSFQKDADGSILVERLFDEQGEPLKA